MSWGYCVAPPGLPVLGPNDGDLECERNAALHQILGFFLPIFGEKAQLIKDA